MKWKLRKWFFKCPLDEIQKEQNEGAMIPNKPRAHLGPELELLLLRYRDDFHPWSSLRAKHLNPKLNKYSQ